ncbi:hypothetical protein HMPREF9551_00165 [Escherichia coli MS 196-1]|nr:hypothetical protein HMPREF9551_00165 [Escherichia coli MS 196-1]
MGKSTIIFGIRNPFKNGYIPYTYSELLIQGLLRYTLMVYKKSPTIITYQVIVGILFN